VDGTATAPKDVLDLLEWNAAHDQIIGALGTMVEALLQHELESINNAKIAWDKLKEKTHSKGIISKLECLTLAICNCIVPYIPSSTTIMEIKDTLKSVFEGGELTNEEWLIVLLLNSLSNGSYDWLRKDLLGFMMNPKITTMSEDIIKRIIAEPHEGTKAIESTLAAKQQTCPKAKSKYCTNCKRTNHTSNKCWEEGGGNHENAPAWIKKGDTNKYKKKVNKDKVYM